MHGCHARIHRRKRSIGIVSHVHTNELEAEEQVAQLAGRVHGLEERLRQAVMPPPPLTARVLLRWESPLRKLRRLLLALLKEDGSMSVVLRGSGSSQAGRDQQRAVARRRRRPEMQPMPGINPPGVRAPAQDEFSSSSDDM